MTNGIRACSSSDTMNADFGIVNPWYYPVTSPSSYQFYNPNFYHPPEYTPPPTPPHYFHPPQPPSYYTPPTSYTSPYLPDSNGIPCYSTYQHEIQAHPNPCIPPLSCFTSPFVATTQFPSGFIDEQRPKLVVSQVFDESPEPPTMLIAKDFEDKGHQMEDKYTKMIQILEKMGKSLAESSKILKGISSKPVSQSSPMINHISNVDYPDSVGILEKTLDVETDDSNDSQLPQLNISAPHMFNESPENEYVSTDKTKSEGVVNKGWKEFVDEKGDNCTFEYGDNESETQWEIADYSLGELNITEKGESNSGSLGLDGVFVVVDSVDFDNKMKQGFEKTELKDIEGRNMLKSEFPLALSFLSMVSACDDGGGRSGNVSEFSTLKEEVKDGNLNGNGEGNAFEESEYGADQSCEEMVQKIYGLNDMSSIVSEEKLLIFDPGGYKKEMNGSEKLRLNNTAMIVVASRIFAVREDVGAKVKKWRDSHVIGFEVACKEGVLTDKSRRDAYVEVLQNVSYIDALQMGVGQDIPAAMTAIHSLQRYKKLYLWEHVYLVGIEASEQVVLERMHNVLNLSQEHGHKLEELQRPGTQVCHIKATVLFVNVQVDFREASLLYCKDCFKKVVDRKTELIIVRVYNLLNVGCMSSEFVKNSLCLGAKFVCADWTFDYVIEVAFAEMNYIIKACKSQVKKWLSKFVVLFVRKKQLTYLYNVYIGLVIVTTKYNGDYQVVHTFKAGGPFTFTRDVYCKVFRSGNYKEAVLSTYRVHDDQILVEIDVKMFFELECDNVCNKQHYLNKLVYSLIAGFQWSIKGGTLAKEDLRDICSEILAPKQANGELYYILNQKPWHKFKKMQKSGGQLVIDTCSPDMLWNTMKAELMEIKDYVKVHVLFVEIIQFLKSYKYSLSRQSSPEMGMDFRNGKDLAASITSDKPIAYAEVFQPTISSREGIKVQLLSLLDVTPLSLDMGIARNVVTVFRLRNTIIPTKKKQVSDYKHDVTVRVFRCSRTRINVHYLVGIFEPLHTPLLVKRMALSWYCNVAMLVARRCLQIEFILEDKDDFKGGYLSRSSKRTILLVLDLCHSPKQSPTNTEAQ